ncbi:MULTISPECIES: dTDP-4-dehydrorhamnose reductase [unclassified Bacillus (in: firmicutes)]|uniref:dTDP-4-dehydrorhamnose reductase n=1 Tax=unclassified Bacillus (in: firmicutes) TaxID=185979 RepID=UPI001BE9AA25|nr:MULTISPECIES: dTDP-4-dehydrorhamnose reductase [unclassified Bacillus (in: firmicutes)]MBT2618566.1 dTDP-4-dehydrorhamnose reductase [Bacillus sp. ISL-78]MBT2629165.1 dTDP-4-dehydrorhamnose reductase [Bacillus sp. ISL-101]MBT2717330.1 dTDP-4-dehydrorhamnose reductase [Bacillus sp. ISL-57]
MDIVITGANGQLGKELERRLGPFHNVVSLSKNDLDISEKEEVYKKITHLEPQIIIHAAAFTAVDQCETDRRKAFEVNSLGTGYISNAANMVGARVFYISSDYVFDGNKQSPYLEEDVPNPQSIYGISKWIGEQFVLSINNGIVIRTSWLYGHEGKNFVKTMLELAKKNKEIRVVNDQVGSPTYVNDLAETISHLLNKKSGIYHVCNEGSCSWYIFAKAIFEEAGFDPYLVKTITTEEFGALAPRPHFSVLENKALLRENVQIPRPWNEALKEFIRKEVCHD